MVIGLGKSSGDGDPVDSEVRTRGSFTRNNSQNTNGSVVVMHKLLRDRIVLKKCPYSI